MIKAVNSEEYKMADLENKIKEVAGQATDVAKSAAEGVKEEAKAFAADTKGYASDAVENIKTEGKEVVEEIKAAVTGDKLDTASTEGAAGYREKGAASPLEIAAVALGAISLLLRGIIGLIVGLVAAVLGAKCRKDRQTSLATIGFVLGALGTVVSLIMLVF